MLSAAVFILQKLSHTDPVHAYLGANASKAAIERESKVLGYDRPIIDQYFHYVHGLLHGNLQVSLRTRRPVATDLATYLPATFELTALRHVPGRRPRRPARPGVGAAMAGRGLLPLRHALRRVGAAVPAGPARDPVLLQPAALAAGNRATPAYTDAADRADRDPGRSTPCCTAVGHDVGDAMRPPVLPGLCVALGPSVSIGRVLRTSLVSNLRSDLRAHGPGQGSDRTSGVVRATPSATPSARLCR